MILSRFGKISDEKTNSISCGPGTRHGADAPVPGGGGCRDPGRSCGGGFIGQPGGEIPEILLM